MRWVLPWSGWFVAAAPAVSGELLHSGSARTRMMKFVISSNAEDAVSAESWLLGTGHEMSRAEGVVKEFVWNSFGIPSSPSCFSVFSFIHLWADLSLYRPWVRPCFNFPVN